MLVFGLVGVLVLGLVVVAMGQRMLRPGRRTSGMADSLGNFEVDLAKGTAKIRRK